MDNLGGHYIVGLFFGVISIHFRAFLGVANFNIFGMCLIFLICLRGKQHMFGPSLRMKKN